MSSGHVPNPNITETDGVSVILQFERALRRVWRVGQRLAVRRRSENLGVVVQNQAIKEDGDVGRAHEGVVLEDRRLEYDVEGLPLTWRAAGVHEGWMLAIDSSGGTIRIGRVLIPVEYLDFIDAHLEDAAVAATLTVTLNNRRGRPFEVELAAPEVFPGVDVPSAGYDFHAAVIDPPLCWTVAARALPG